MAHAEPASKGPIVTPPPHTDAYMDMAARRGMFAGFGMMAAWGSLLVILVVGYATFTITMHVPWIGAMIGFAVFGIAAGLLMNLGGAWIATVIGLCVLGVFVEILIWLGSMLLG
jgi:hypothetical protein